MTIFQFTQLSFLPNCCIFTTLKMLGLAEYFQTTFAFAAIFLPFCYIISKSGNKFRSLMPKNPHLTKTTRVLENDNLAKLETTFTDITQLFLLNPSFISNSDKLQLYALFKQATANPIRRPTFWQLLTEPRSRAWYLLHLRGISPTHAKSQYCQLYKHLEAAEARHLTEKNYQGGRHRDSRIKKYNFKPILYPGHIIIPLEQLPPTLLMEYNASVKVKYMAAGRGKSAFDLKAKKDPRPIRDRQFVQIYSETHFSKMVHCLSDFDIDSKIKVNPEVCYKKLFGLPEDGDSSDYFILDTTAIQVLPLKLEDYAVLCPGVVLFKKDATCASLTLVAIATENLTSTPTDGAGSRLLSFPGVLQSLQILHPCDGVAWELAKFHVAAASNYISSLGVHPLLHVTLSGPISLTCEALQCHNPLDGAKPSIIRRIISTHSYAQSAVDSNAFDFKESVVWADQFPYYPWAVDTSFGGVYNVTQLICDGTWEGHPIYGIKGLDPTQRPRNHSVLPFRTFINSLEPIIQNFVRNIVTLALKHDPAGVEFEFCSKFLNLLFQNLPLESPWRDQITKFTQNHESTLVIMTKLLTYFILNTFEHSMDHFMLESHLLRDIQVLLRSPVDFRNKSQKYADILRAGALNSASDRSKYYLMSHMFFHPHVSQSFNDFFVKGGGYFGQDGSGIRPEKLEQFQKCQEQFVNQIVEAFNNRNSEQGSPFMNMTLDDIGISVQS